MLQVIWRIPIFKTQFPDGVPIYGFGLMLFFAFILCTWMGGRRGEREGIKKETIQDLALWIFIGGLLGARITFLMQENPTLLRDKPAEFLMRLPKIWDGGIILYGSVLGGIAGYIVSYLLVFRKQGLSTLRLADVIAPTIAVGLCLGRMGCFLNGCCYGQVACSECAVCPVSFPMSAPSREYLVDNGSQTAAGFTLVVPQPPGIKGVQVALVDPTSPAAGAGLKPGAVITRVNGHPVNGLADVSTPFSLGPRPDNWPRGRWKLELEYEPRPGDEPETMTIMPMTLGLYPTQLYEVVSMFLLLLVLLAYDPLRRNPGQVMAVLMVGYGIHRSLNELLRDDPRPVSLELLGSAVLVVAGVVLWTVLNRMAPANPVKPVGAASRQEAVAIPG
jgi:prolipoprotein diacylglyceryltransferase